MKLQTKNIALLLPSPPTWGRGLKLGNPIKAIATVTSPPTWGRGLKHCTDVQMVIAHKVAPHVGAWIETL